MSPFSPLTETCLLPPLFCTPFAHSGVTTLPPFFLSAAHSPITEEQAAATAARAAKAMQRAMMMAGFGTLAEEKAVMAQKAADMLQVN